MRYFVSYAFNGTQTGFGNVEINTSAPITDMQSLEKIGGLVNANLKDQFKEEKLNAVVINYVLLGESLPVEEAVEESVDPAPVEAPKNLPEQPQV